MDGFNIMEEIRDFFKSIYNGIENSESFLSFENIGLAIDGDEFTDFEGNVSEEKALEQLSIMADQLPEIKDKFFTDTSSLSSVYRLLVDSARFDFKNQNINLDDTMPIFNDRISNAKKMLDQFTQTSIKTPFGDFLPVYPSVNQWFNPKKSIWTKKEFNLKENTKKSSKTTPIAWRTNFLADANELKTITNQPATQQTKKFLGNKSIQELKTLGYNTKIFNSRPKLNSLKLKKGKKEEALRLRKKHDSLNKKKLVQLYDLKPLMYLDISDRFLLTNQLARIDKAKLKPVESNHLSISFEYTIVKLNRPWFKNILFDISDLWYSINQKAGYYSNGKKDSSNDGILKCFTTAMILIKNIEISAAWTDQDKKNAKHSMALENFNLSNSVFTNNKIKSEGIQIFGWMCNVLPKLPKTSCPSIIN